MRKFGLIGSPLRQSFSKKFFTEKFASENLLNCVYNLYPLNSIEELHLLLGEPQLEGLNVTIPYKKAVIPFLHELDEVVEKVQACNCINIKNEKLRGYNTDVIGFEKSLLPLLKTHHTRALILGTGGAAAAVEYVVAKLGIEYLYVSRTSNRHINTINYSEVDASVLSAHSVIVNTTPLGMFPGVDESPAIPYQFLGEKHLLYDLIYNPEKTTFLKRGEEQGTSIKNGFEMLVIQAEESWKIWNEKTQ